MSLTADELSSDERKRLGQYFTGLPLAKLLAALSGAGAAGSVIDPMAGIGDMLVAAGELAGADPINLHAVEIDPDAADRARDRLTSFGNSSTMTANAFNPMTWDSLQHRAWGLVITNPPYVRYQRTSQAGEGRVSTPSAAEVRQGLIDIIASRTCLPEDERKVMTTLAREYSGLADLAVPSWILCAALVEPGGRLAMVVPDTWLSRDYALPVVYLLRRFFDLEYVLEDADAAWFPDALIRTHLVVARRIQTRTSALGADGLAHPFVRIGSEAAANGSLVVRVAPDSRQPERAVGKLLDGIAVSAAPVTRPGLTACLDNGSHLRGSLESGLKSSRWLRALEPADRFSEFSAEVPYLPRRLAGAVGDVRDELPLVTLKDLGWAVGQGLRTGANRFFYATCLSEEAGITELQLDQVFGRQRLQVPTEVLRTVVRNQRDLADAEHRSQASAGRLLYLDRFALDEDIERARSVGVQVDYARMPRRLAEHVRRAAVLNVGTSDSPRFIPDLSAVAPNARNGGAERPPRFWYQLPRLAPRHVGRLYVARINHGHPTFFRNDDGIVIDANFTTLWPTGEGSVSLGYVSALLASTWAVVAMEAIGTVMGGGALKLEATHLRRLPLPLLPEDGVQEVLAERSGLEQHLGLPSPEIDNLVSKCLGSDEYLARLSTTRHLMLQERRSA